METTSNSKRTRQDVNRMWAWLPGEQGRGLHLAMPRYALFASCILTFALVTSACTTEAEKTAAAAPATVQIGAENVVRVVRDTIVVGPIISGELKAEREANVRAQLGG